jgi:hypothetical protein
MHMVLRLCRTRNNKRPPVHALIAQAARSVTTWYHSQCFSARVIGIGLGEEARRPVLGNVSTVAVGGNPWWREYHTQWRGYWEHCRFAILLRKTRYRRRQEVLGYGERDLGQRLIRVLIDISI